MKITDMRTILLSYLYKRENESWTWSAGKSYGWSTALIEVSTDEGLTGLGEVIHAFEIVPKIVEIYKERIVGEDPFNVEKLRRRMYNTSMFWSRRGLSVAVAGGIETALWDIIGKAKNMPVYQLLGGFAQAYDKIRVYASAGEEKPLDELIKEVKGYVDNGFTAVKLRTGYSIQKQKEIVKNVREAIGDRVGLIVDNGACQYLPDPWTVPMATKLAKTIEEYDPLWLEEPWYVDDIDGYAAITSNTNVPIAMGETVSSRYEFKRILDKRAVDYIQPDIGVVGGLLESKRIAALASTYFIPLAPHCWGSGVNLAAYLHFVASTPNVIIAELCELKNPLRQELLIEPIHFQDGYVQPPRLPGLGVQITDKIVEKYPFDPKATLRRYYF